MRTAGVGDPASDAGVFDTLLFAACALTYAGVAAFARSLGRAAWLGRRAARAYVSLNLLALRGLSFPDPTMGRAPWYTEPDSSSASPPFHG